MVTKKLSAERSEYFFWPNTNTNIFGMFYLARIRIRIYSGSYFGPNTNTNIFVMLQWTEYEYSNIFGLNIRIFLVRIYEYHFGQTFKYSMEQIGHKVCIPWIPRSQLCYYLCQSCIVLPSSAQLNPTSIQLDGLSSTKPPPPRFVQPSMTVEKWWSDICSSNICPSSICLGNIPQWAKWYGQKENSDLQAGIWFGSVALSPIITLLHFTMV